MTKKTMSNVDSITKYATATAPSDRPCIHAKLQLQLVVPEECLVRGDIGAWYACLQCGQHFRSDIKPYEIKVATAAQTTPEVSQAPAGGNVELERDRLRELLIRAEPFVAEFSEPQSEQAVRQLSAEIQTALAPPSKEAQ